MGTERPKKRLVGLGEYLDAVCTKGATSLVATALRFGGAVLLTAAASAVLPVLVEVCHGDISGAEFCIFAGAILGLFGAIATWLSCFFFEAAKEITPVALLTRSSANGLPEKEILVRGADRPATDQQTELLRATGQGLETPPAQLLRATQNGGPDV